MTANSPTATSTAQTTSLWQIDASHTLVEFSVRHMMISTVKGRFTGVSGTIVDVNDDPSRSSVEIHIDAATITTSDDKRDGHLRSPDFFDVEKFPQINFKSTRIEGTPERFKVTGDLTVRDQTRPVTLDATFNGGVTNPYGKQVRSFSAETKLNRKDWGLNWNVALEAGGVLVSDEFKLSLEVEAIRQDAS